MTLLPWVIYPLVMSGAFSLFAVLRLLGVPLGPSTYLTIVAGALTVAALERVLPYRAAWHPGAEEFRTDMEFIAIVQLVFPPIMSFVFTSALVGPARRLGLPTTVLWPHGWPIWVQVVLMVLTVDLMRYWLHRASHKNDLLWRLHAVHHSVGRLYWLNTSRFHVIEKALQMLLDSLPFLLMGVQVEVLSLYYVTYSVNGFLQHSNIDMRYGFLNYIVGSAETHRWHHSLEPRESNTNYGSTLVLWDLVFGTWFLPKDREVAALGLREAGYPRTFIGLLRAPFKNQF
jgi:sterol desaturase/sphingolipid hydroxylase (fatty acid hydroxylase superfamily)